jgi:hypothetical protein
MPEPSRAYRYSFFCPAKDGWNDTVRLMLSCVPEVVGLDVTPVPEMVHWEFPTLPVLDGVNPPSHVVLALSAR